LTLSSNTELIRQKQSYAHQRCNLSPIPTRRLTACASDSTRIHIPRFLNPSLVKQQLRTVSSRPKRRSEMYPIGRAKSSRGTTSSALPRPSMPPLQRGGKDIRGEPRMQALSRREFRVGDSCHAAHAVAICVRRIQTPAPRPRYYWS